MPRCQSRRRRHDLHRSCGPGRLTILLIAVALLAVAGCASLDARPEVERSTAELEQAIGDVGGAVLLDEDVARTRTADLLAGGVSTDEAVQIALLNSPRVRAAMLSIGISRADFVQSTLFTNPMLTMSLRLPDGGGLANFETTLTQNIAELWLIPARKLAAQRELDRAVLDAARTAASIAYDVRSSYARAVRALNQVALTEEMVSVTSQLLDLAQSRQRAGTGSDIDVNLARTQQQDAETALRNARLAAFEERSALSRLMGLPDSPEALQLNDSLAEVRPWTVTTNTLQTIAGTHRLDLRIAEQTVAVAEARSQEERMRFLKSLQVGFAMERIERRSQGDRNWLAETYYDTLQSGQLTPPNLMPREPQGTNAILGPSFGVELPLWDQNQAQVARADRVLEQSRQLRDALLIDVAQDIHTALARARTASENARFYRAEQLPTAQRSIELSREAYRAGRLSFLSVLEAQRNYFAARSGYLATMESAALATVDLERAIGRPASSLPAESAAPPLSPSSQPNHPSSLEVSP